MHLTTEIIFGVSKLLCKNFALSCRHTIQAAHQTPTMVLENRYQATAFQKASSHRMFCWSTLILHRRLPSLSLWNQGGFIIFAGRQNKSLCIMVFGTYRKKLFPNRKGGFGCSMGVKWFHQYLFGRQFFVSRITNHYCFSLVRQSRCQQWPGYNDGHYLLTATIQDGIQKRQGSRQCRWAN